MKCTECNKTVRPCVAIDLDGTLGDYIGHFTRHAEDYLGRYLLAPEYDGSMGFKDWCRKHWGISTATWSDIKLTYRQGAQKRTMPIYKDAQLLCDGVRKRAELWLTTTRPYLRHDNIDPDTREWLDRHGIKYDGLIYDEDKYRQLYNIVGPDRVCAVLDDLAEEADSAGNTFGWNVPIIRGTKHNIGAKPVTGAPRVNDLKNALMVIELRIDRWERNHA